MSKNLATLIGFSAILQWSAIVGLLKRISSSIGPDYAIAFMYSFSAIILLLLFHIPNLKAIPKKYFISATILFVVYELCFSYAIALAQSPQQAIEISLVNYLWPSMTITALILFKELKFNPFVVLGLAVSLSGIVLIQTGNGAFSWSSVFDNIMANPVSYVLAFLGAALWSLYCVITKKYSNGHNPIALFFIVITAVLWSKMYFLHSMPALPSLEFDTLFCMLAVSIVTALGYAAWNIGIIKGNITLLVTLSYFSPLISSVFSMLILQTHLAAAFWHGAILVTLGSFICWISTNWAYLKEILRPDKQPF